MAKRISRLTSPILILTLSLAAVSCAKRHQTSVSGGQDSGGGFVAYSTPDEVNAALDKAIELVTEPRAEKNIIAQFWWYWGRKGQYQVIKRPAHVFPKLAVAEIEKIDLENDSSLFESAPIRALKSNRITRLPKGNCLTSGVAHHNDASVSAFSVNADICFSVGNLTRIPPKSLLREVLSLVLHEVSHMGGASEAEAVTWQEEFAAYFEVRFGDLETDDVTLDTRSALKEASALVANAQAIAQKNINNPKIFALMGDLAGRLGRMPYYSDTLALQLKTKALKPDLVNNYSLSVLALRQKVMLRFVIKEDTFKVKGITIRLEFLTPEKVIPTLNEIAADLVQVSENFEAFLGGSPRARSVCVKPDESGDLNLFPLRPPGGNSPDTIQRRCDAEF